MDYKQRIRDLREDREMKQSEVAEILGIDQRTYSRYETGANKMPIEYLKKLCILYKTSADYIIGLTNEPRRLK